MRPLGGCYRGARAISSWRFFVSGEASGSVAWPARQGGRKQGRRDSHLGERVERLALCLGGRFASANVSLGLGFRFMRQHRTRRLEHHAFRPFMIRMDPDVDFLIERNVRTRAGRCGAAQRSAARRKLPSHPKFWNSGMAKELNDDEPIATRGGRPR